MVNRSILKLLSGLFCIFVLIAIFADDPNVSGFGKAVLWLCFALGFGIAAWYYDALIKKLSLIDQTNQHLS
jgi:hypothetical protein